MQEIFILGGVFFAAFVGTLTGFGTSTILIPLLILFYPFPEVLVFVGIIHWFSNVWKMYFFKKGRSWDLLLTFGLAGIVGGFLGARLTLSLDQNLMQKFLGLFLILYSLFIFYKPSAKLKRNTLNSSVGGLASGISAGIFGVGGAVRGAFLSAFGFKKETYLFTAGALGIIIDISRLTTYWQQGYTLSELRWWWLLPGVALSLVGAWLAKQLVDKIPQKIFRLLIVLALTILGVYYLFK